MHDRLGTASHLEGPRRPSRLRPSLGHRRGDIKDTSMSRLAVSELVVVSELVALASEALASVAWVAVVAESVEDGRLEPPKRHGNLVA
jgi:hypothetical protein